MSRDLEDRLFDAVWQCTVAEEGSVRLAISTALTLARREGYAMRAAHCGYTGEAPEVLASSVALPTRTVRRLREETDPHGVGVTYRYVPEVDAPEDEFSMGDPTLACVCMAEVFGSPRLSASPCGSV